MRTVLAADIGGTNSRFGHFELCGEEEPRLVESCVIPTRSVHSFSEMLDQLQTRAFGLRPEQADRVVLAVAGPIQDGSYCKLTNAAWDIDLALPGLGLPAGKTQLINDFVAQALGGRTAASINSAVVVHEGVPRSAVVAAVGAGTGLGHCALVPVDGYSGRFVVLPSEGGHAPLAFTGQDEAQFCRFLELRTGHVRFITETVVSGPGLSLVHEFLTGRRLAPVDVATEIGPESPTTTLFARFYGRVCRTYCLYVLARGGLDICGGLAVKNPHFVTQPEFRREFIECPAYGPMLSEVPIRLITNPYSGLFGAAHFTLL